jgi:hypothetical protein
MNLIKPFNLLPMVHRALVVPPSSALSSAFQWKEKPSNEAKERRKEKKKHQQPKTVLNHSRRNEKFENSETVHIVRATT